MGYTKTVSRQFWVKRSWSKYACGHFSASMPVVLSFRDVFKAETISSSVEFFLFAGMFFFISADFLCLQSTSKMSNDRFILLDDFFVHGVTHLKFNIAPEKWWLEDYTPNGKVSFQGLC